jgi:hypothetical protein
MEELETIEADDSEMKGYHQLFVVVHGGLEFDIFPNLLLLNP